MSSVDVIVPCYRYGCFLRQCVESVLAQSVGHVRVLIIDDASPDNTSAVASVIAKDDSRVTFIRHTVNKGHISVYNEGIQWASAEYMLLLSADDYLLPGALSRAVKLMDAHPEVGFCFGKGITVNAMDPTMQLGTVADCTDQTGWRIVAGLEFIGLSGAHNIVSTPTAVVRTELQKRVGGYRPELPHSGDMEMWLRLAAHASVGTVEAYQAVYRQHAGNMSRAYTTKYGLRDVEQRKAALDCFFHEFSPTLPNAQQLRHAIFWSLGREAIGFASTAFNDGEMEISERLSDFALGVCPGIKRSWYWSKLACKRHVGYPGWRALRAAVGRLRQMAWKSTGKIN